MESCVDLWYDIGKTKEDFLMKKIKLLIVTLAIATLSTFPALADWQQEPDGRWWYRNEDGSYPVNQWQEINGKQYYFGSDGYMLTNTTTPDGKQVGADGALVDGNSNTYASGSGEITFQNIAWGTDYASIDRKYGNWNLMPIHSEWTVNPSVDAVLMDNYYTGINFEYSDINIIASSINYQPMVAGYKASEINLYFAFVPVNGKLTKKESDTSLYGASYKFEPQNLAGMTADLKNKLSSLYGQPVKVTTDSDIWGNKSEFTWWSGANGTELVLKSFDSSADSTGIYDDEIVISYAWRYGDTLMQTASDTLKNADSNAEMSNYGSGNVNGL